MRPSVDAGSRLAFAGLGWARDVPAVAALSAAFLACAAVGGTCSMSLRQEVAPQHLLGRVTSAFWTLHYAAAPVGAALLTWAAEEQGTTPVALAAGATCVLLAVTALFTPVRGSGRSPVDPAVVPQAPPPQQPGSQVRQQPEQR